ncbi:MAG: endonuclease domain-containing protein [Balneolaceae bacterium]|nr:endonuclease domain-containing protein [Balneolaceae bacterium]
MVKFKNNLHAGAHSQVFENAKQLRLNQTNAEDVLWQYLRARRFENLKFRRQHPIHSYVADFYCHEKRLIIEVDGGYHNKIEQKRRDESRTSELEKLGLQVVRFSNAKVIENIEGCLSELRDIIKNDTSP